MIILWESFNPTIAGSNWECTTSTFGCKQIIPIFFTVRQCILKVERRISERSSTVCTGKTCCVPLFVKSVQTFLYRTKHIRKLNERNIGEKPYSFDALLTFCTIRSEMCFKTAFTVETALLFNEASFFEWTFAESVCTNEMIRAPSFVHCHDVLSTWRSRN